MPRRLALAAIVLSLAGCPSGGGPVAPPPPPPPAHVTETLADATGARGVTAVGGRAVWSEPGPAAVRAVAATGGTPATLASRFDARGLGIEGGFLFRLEFRVTALGAMGSAVVVRSGLDGTSPEDLAVVSTGAADTRAILRAGRVVAQVCVMSPSGCTLRVVPLDGNPPVDLLTTSGGFGGLEADATHAYWIGGDTVLSLRRISLSGGAPEVVAEPGASAFLGAFALDGPSVVVSEVDFRLAVPVSTQGTQRRVLRVPASGGARTVLAEQAGDGGVGAVLVRGQEIVWHDDSGVFSTPLEGGATNSLPSVALPVDYTASSFVSAGGALYWSASNSSFASTSGLVAPVAGGEGWTGLYLPTLFAADDVDLYWDTRSGQVSRAPAAGGPAEVVAGGFVGQPLLASSGGRLYGAAGPVVKQLDLTGAAPRELFLADDTVLHLAADADAVYAVSQAGTLWRFPAPSGPLQRVADGISGVRVARGYAYWTQGVSEPFGTAAIYRMPVTGGDRVEVARGMAFDSDLLVAGDHIYFMAPGDALSRVPVGGGSIQLLTSNYRAPLKLAADATHLYAANFQFIFKIPLAGGATETLDAGDHISPTELAVDDTGVYWADSFYEAVFRLTPK